MQWEAEAALGELYPEQAARSRQALVANQAVGAAVAAGVAEVVVVLAVVNSLDLLNQTLSLALARPMAHGIAKLELTPTSSTSIHPMKSWIVKTRP